MSDQFFWYVTRAAALVTWFSAALAILVGLVTSSRLLGRRPTIPWLVDLHRLFAGMSIVFLAIHMASLWFDSFVRFRLDDLLVPWAASVPGLTRTSIALGVISAWLIVAVQATSLVRERMPERLWRAVHLLSYGTLFFGTLHALQAGSDARNPILVALGVSIITAIVLATGVRVARLRQPEPVLDGDKPEPPQAAPQQPNGGDETAVRTTQAETMPQAAHQQQAR